MTTTINNEHKKLNVPNLRFPEFQGEWKEHKLEDITAEIGDGIHATPIYDDNGTFYFVNGNNISEYGITITATTQKVTEEEALRNNASALNSYSILLSINGTVGNVALYKNESIMLGKSACYINVSSNINRNYIFYYLMMPKCQFYFTSELTGTTIKNLSLKSIRKTKVLLPNANEQSKIARLFDAINERIATQNKIIEDLKKLKSAISHILFSSKGAIHLSEIANVVMGQSPSSNAYNDQGLGMPLVQGNLDISNGKTTPRLYTAEFNQTTEKGNIILTVRAPVGEVAKATQKVCLGRGVCAIIPHEENMSDFIYQYLTFYKFMWRRYEQGSTFTSINGSDVRNIFCPKVRNVSILTLLDIKINIEERVVKQYQSQKQYMLYQMFI